MSSVPYSREWIYLERVLANILLGISDPNKKENFLERIEWMSREEGKTEVQIIRHYSRPGAAEEVDGYQKFTPYNLGDPRVHQRSANEQRRRDDGGSQAGARHGSTSAQMSGLEFNTVEPPRYTGYPRDPYGGLRRDFPASSRDPDFYDITDPYGNVPNNPQPTPYSSGYASQRGSAYNGYQQPNTGSRGSPYSGYQQYLTNPDGSPYNSNDQANRSSGGNSYGYPEQASRRSRSSRR